MQTIESQTIQHTDIENVEASLAKLEDSPLAAQLQSIIRLLRDGADVIWIPGESDLTPNQAAKMLRISRPLVMAMIKRGEITAHIVGERDRRIPLSEIMNYIERRDRASREVAAAFARGDSSMRKLIAHAAGVKPDRAAELGF